MKLKDLFAFKDWLSYRQKVGLLVIAGVVCGLGGLFMYLLRAHTYFIGDNPSACVNCHIMSPYYATWSHSSHGRIDHQSNGATCNDCHVPHQNLAVYYGFKAVDGLKHTAYFRLEAHSILRRPHGASGHQGRDTDRTSGDGQLHPLSHATEHRVCKDGPHGLYDTAGSGRQGLLGLSSGCASRRYELADGNTEC